MENLTSAKPCDANILIILAALEQQLVALDQVGARIAAAHVDAAIHQLRTDRARN